MLLKTWTFLPQGGPIPEALVNKYSLTPLLCRILSARGITGEAELSGLFGAAEQPFWDPMLLRDMDRAVARVMSAVKNGEKICVYGDYDVDGVTSTYILVTYLRSLGAQTEFYIPDRVKEGYGLCECAIKDIAAGGTGLIVTVDTGISACAEAALAASLGVDMVVLDHHECGCTLPEVCAVVDPRRADCAYPYKNLAGVGVAYKFAAAASGDPEGMFARYGDMVALGTVADAMPLTGENRTIVMRGFELIKNTANLGLRALMKAVGITGDTTVSTVGFSLAPRLNAAGRMTSAREAMRLFLAGDEAEADEAAQKLCELNCERQKEEKLLLHAADEMIRDDIAAIVKEHAIVLCGEGWHHGTIGIVAARLAEKYNLPTVLLTRECGKAKGSARSVGDFNIYQALAKASEGIACCGGHEKAAGIKMPEENFPAFKAAFTAITREALGEGIRNPRLALDLELRPEELSFAEVNSLSRLEPYGTDNQTPLFALRDMRITEVAPLGEGKHTRLSLTNGGAALTALAFRMQPEKLRFVAGDVVDIAFSAEVNVYRSSRAVRLIAKDMRPCASQLERENRAAEDFKRLLSGDPPDRPVPGRELFVAVWKALKAASGGKRINISPAQLLRRASPLPGLDEYALLFILGVFTDEKLIKVERIDEEQGYGAEWAVTFPECAGKSDLEGSRLVRMASEGRV